eukprot:7531630-Pyramimonas_sp.AAC.2
MLAVFGGLERRMLARARRLRPAVGVVRAARCEVRLRGRCKEHRGGRSLGHRLQETCQGAP